MYHGCDRSNHQQDWPRTRTSFRGCTYETYWTCSKAVQTNAQLLRTWTIVTHMSRTMTESIIPVAQPVRFDHGMSHYRAHWSHLVGPIAKDKCGSNPEARASPVWVRCCATSRPSLFLRIWCTRRAKSKVCRQDEMARIRPRSVDALHRCLAGVRGEGATIGAPRQIPRGPGAWEVVGANVCRTSVEHFYTFSKVLRVLVLHALHPSRQSIF